MGYTPAQANLDISIPKEIDWNDLPEGFKLLYWAILAPPEYIGPIEPIEEDPTKECVECGKEAEKDSFYCRSCWDELDRQGFFESGEA